MIDRKALSVREVAAQLGVSESWVYRKIKEGELPARRLSSGMIRIPVVEFDEWLSDDRAPVG